MHEASIAESILQIASKRLQETENTERVKSVHVLVGEFRNVEPESLHFTFDSLKTFYPGLENCKLVLDLVETRAYCRGEKQHLYSPSFEKQYCCDKCGSGMGALVCGEELEIIKICLLARQIEEKKECMKA